MGNTNDVAKVIGAAAAGAAAMYYLDPERGRRRRSLVRDQFTHLRRSSMEGARTAARDMGNRGVGILGATRYRLTGGNVDDLVLEARVHTRLGRAVSHPSAIEVHAEDGRVYLRGPVLQDEAESMLNAASSVPGVREIINRTQAYKEPGDVPALQGGRSPRRLAQGRPDFMQENWAPATRALAGAGGLGLLYWGFRRGGFLMLPAMLFGAGILLRAMSNKPVRRLAGVGAGRRAVDIHKTINIDAPVEQVFELWSRPSNFPYFMSHVKDVREGADGRSHWKVSGPFGVPVEWDAEITRYEPERILAWKTLDGASVDHAGIIHFQENADGSTRADIRMSYNPPGGAAGHVVAQLFRSDPKQELDEDLMRMKSFIETGRMPSDAAKAEALA